MNSELFSHRSQRSWLKISVTAPEREIEIAGGFLADFTGNGVEYISASAENSTTGGTTLIGYLEIDSDIEEKKEHLADFFNTLLPSSEKISVQYDTIVEEDWGESWKKNFKPFHVTERLVIKPSWETFVPPGREIVLEIDPGMAFGTGHHASTCLALELTDSYFDTTGTQPRSVLDVGTGTGIVGIACCLLGRGRVLATDNDPDAVAIARVNARINQVDDVMEITDTPLSDITGCYDLIIANIIHDVLVEIAPGLYHLLGNDGELILSGILRGEQADDILRIYGNEYGLKPLQMPVKHEWQAFRFKKGK